MATSAVIQQRRIVVDDFEIDFVQLADGSYGLNSSQLARLLGVKPETLRMSIALPPSSTQVADLSALGPQLSLVNKSSFPGQQVQVMGVVSLTSLVAFLQAQTRAGNPKAQQLFQALAARAFESYIAGIFTPSATEVETLASSVAEAGLRASAQDSQDVHAPDVVWAAYSASKQERQEVYRRLAGS